MYIFSVINILYSKIFVNKKYTIILYLDVLNLRIGRIAAGSSRLEYFVLYVLYLDTYHAYIRYITYDVRKDVCMYVLWVPKKTLEYGETVVRLKLHDLK